MKRRNQTNRIMVHCSATPEGRDVSTETIKSWHVDDNGWDDIGYHRVIELDGSAHQGRPDEMQGAGCAGENHDTLHVCYVGGMDAENRHPKDTLNSAQENRLIEVISEWQAIYGLDWSSVVGHNQYAAKACPSFNVLAWVAGLDVDGGDPGDKPDPLGMRIDKLEAWARSFE